MAYATAAQLIARKDVRTIGDLASDDGSRVLLTDLLTHANVTAALDSASGAVEAAIMAGNRYTPADLAALTGNSAAYLVQITCDVAMAGLHSRRPTLHAEQHEAALKVAGTHLEMLRKGTHVFQVAEVLAAGVPSVAVVSVAEVQSQNLIRDVTLNYYPRRRVSQGT